jgi:hypothetical protein
MVEVDADQPLRTRYTVIENFRWQPIANRKTRTRSPGARATAKASIYLRRVIRLYGMRMMWPRGMREPLYM